MANLPERIASKIAPVDPRGREADMMIGLWQVACDAIEAALDEAERRGDPLTCDFCVCDHVKFAERAIVGGSLR